MSSCTGGNGGEGGVQEGGGSRGRAGEVVAGREGGGGAEGGGGEEKLHHLLSLDGCSFMRHQPYMPYASSVSTPLLWIFKKRVLKS